jgi:hypothetical protein
MVQKILMFFLQDGWALKHEHLSHGIMLFQFHFINILIFIIFWMDGRGNARFYGLVYYATIFAIPLRHLIA